MKLDDLIKYGIPQRIIDIWKERQGQGLLPVQSKAVRKGLLESHRDKPTSVILSAPTSSGKSFCAEMAMVKALILRQKTVLLFPLKSLAEQTRSVFYETYRQLGIKVIIATSDHPENDAKLRRGDYQVAIVIYEKFDQLLTESLDALKNIGLVVIDEIQSVAEPGRGAILERLLTKIKASVYTPSLLALSAVIGDSDKAACRLAEWLDADLIEENSRPVDLIRGVATEGTFRFRSYNNGLDGDESFAGFKAGDDPFKSFARQVKKDSGSTLVFLKSRHDTVQQAFRLASAVDWPEATKAIGRLDGEEASFLVRTLKQTLSRGIAFHNSDLSPNQRTIVEQAFTNNEVRALFSTTTLAMGVNLPADTVYLETVKYSAGAYGGKPSLVPVTRAEFDNMTGRAGRLGQSEDRPGRAIILAQSEFDREVLWENYIENESGQEIKSAFESMPLADWLLNLIVTTHGSESDDDLITIFKHSLYAHSGGELTIADLQVAIATLIDSKLLETESGAYRPTVLGRAAARVGLSVAETAHFAAKLSAGYPETDLGWIALALSSPNWPTPPGILSYYEQSQNVPLKMLYQSFDGGASEVSRFLIGDVSYQQTLDYRPSAALKALLLLDQWRRLEPVEKLEERYQLHLGQILSLGESVSHLLISLSALIMAGESESPLIDKLKELSFAVRTGLPFSLSRIYRSFGKILSRSDFAALAGAGIEKPAELQKLSEEELSSLVSGDHKRKLFMEQYKQLKQEVDMSIQAGTINVGAETMMPVARLVPDSIEVDGSLEGERYLVRINGFPVRLTGKSFKYFTKLAWSRLNGDSGWIYKEDIEIGFNQARYLYRMKNEVNAFLNFAWPMIENNRLGYYRLNVDPSRIQVNLDKLKDHPDYEIRSIVAARAGEALN